MRTCSIVLCALGLSLAVSCVYADSVIAVSGSQHLDKVLAENDFVVAEFYAPWCGHCKRLEPEYAKASEPLQDEGITLVKVDATEEANKALAEEFEVKGFPTMKIFKNNDRANPVEYDGPREADGIVSYLKKQAGPATTHITSKASIKSFYEKDVGVIGVFKSNTTKEFKAFQQTADTLRADFEFGHVTEPELVEGVTKVPSVLLFKNYDDQSTSYTGKFTSKALTEWIEETTVPKLIEMNQQPHNRKALQKVFGASEPKLIGFAAQDYSQLDEFKDALRQAAQSIATIKIVFADASANSGAMQYFGIKDTDVPAFAIHDATNNAKYMAAKASPEDLTSFVAQFEAGKLEKVVKSEDPPKDNSGPVKVVTAKTFDEIVFSGKDVLIEFYAPWCGHCKSLAPTYEKVGEAFADNKTVTVAKMDATANDVPSDKFSVSGFPTIMFVSGKDGSVSSYEGSREQDDLIKFINDHSTRSSSVGSGSKDEL
ncbi:hypothetical protein ABBQ32_001008 [Trebouxia sp. C0010 RCD-2024]